MTAEIGMLNRYGVALAADSAATATTSNGQRKVYNSANKVFMLSEVAPLGIMVYGNAVFMDIPWETVIKLFRKRLGEQRYPHLEDYANQFLSFIASELIIESKAYKNFISNKLYEFFDEIESVIEKNNFTSMDETLTTLETLLQDWQVLDVFSGIDALFSPDDQILLNDIISKKHFKNSVTLQDGDSEKIIILLDKYIRIDLFTNESGVVISGYGEDEYFPCLVAYRIEGKVQQILKHIKNKDIKITSDYSADIVPFAQTSMVNTFIKGANPELIDRFKSQIETTVNDLAREFAVTIASDSPDVDQDDLIRAFQETSIKELTKQFSALDDYQYKNHIMPIIDTVRMLNKDELAEMAESLVSITSIEKKMSMDVETVGGPIDVAIISKGDGFIWYKRKHYFNPELNAHYFRNKGM